MSICRTLGESSAVLPYIATLTSSVIRILGRNAGPFTLQGTNTYLVGKGERRILIDAGAADDADYARDLTTVLQQSNSRLQCIICTHWHLDHTGGVPGVLKAVADLNHPVPNVYKLRSGGPDSVDLHPDSRPIDYMDVIDGQRFEVDGAMLRVLTTPGHSTDHICLYLAEENAVFSGDCILGYGSTVVEDLCTYLSSLHRLKRLAPVVIYPGHGPVIDDAVNRIERYISHRQRREEQILKVLDNPLQPFQNTSSIVAAIYGKELNDALLRGAERNVKEHLLKLKKEGKVGDLVLVPPRFAQKKNGTDLLGALDVRLPSDIGCAVFLGSVVHVEDADFGRSLHYQAGFGKLSGKDSDQQLLLFIEEAWYLVSEAKCLQVLAADRAALSTEKTLSVFRDVAPNFLERYAVYRHFRLKNWLVHEGFNYGVDYVLYANLPSLVHSSYAVVIRSNSDASCLDMSFRRLACYSRVAVTVSKELLICTAVERNGNMDVQVMISLPANSAAQLSRCGCLRWAFRLSTWEPADEEWRRSLQYVQEDEVQRIRNLRCRQSAMATVIGRLMLRKAVTISLKLPWEEVKLVRSDRGKPLLANHADADFHFNVSHHGNFVLLAAGYLGPIGVDVMRVQPRKIQNSVAAYLRTMRSHFSSMEWDSFWSLAFNDGDRLRLFYRYWCLKESYLKATGQGIHSALSEIDFRIGRNRPLATAHSDTELYIDKQKVEKLLFEECTIPEDHLVSVCQQITKPSNCSHHPFVLVDWPYITREAVPLHHLTPGQYPLLGAMQ